MAAGVFCLLGLRAAYIATVEAGGLAQKAKLQQRTRVALLAPRGTILSSDDQVLAQDRQVAVISANPRQVSDPARTAQELARPLKTDASRLEALLRSPGGYVVLARALPPGRAHRVLELGLPGIFSADGEERVYPQGRLAGQLVGLTTDGRGLAGVEKESDAKLRGVPGFRLEVRDARYGRTLAVLRRQLPVPGRTVTLALDSQIQGEVEQVLAKTKAEFRAKGTSAIVMDPRDGSILAMASVPRTNPNDRAHFQQEASRAVPVTDQFEPGSTFKLVTMAGALQDRLVTPSTSIFLPESLPIPQQNHPLRDAEQRGPETWTVTQILAKSSNIGTVLVGKKLALAGHLRPWMARFGFGAKTGIDFPGEVAGDLPPHNKWSDASRLNIPIGQGLTATQLQVARAYAAVANGGYLVTPHLAEGSAPGSRRRIIGARTAAELTEMLRSVVSSSDGTGVLARVAGYHVAGKTGTAQKVDPKTHQYVHRYRSSFVGFLPAERPRLLISVMVDDPDPDKQYSGGLVAAPAFSEIADFALQRLAIPPP